MPFSPPQCKGHFGEKEGGAPILHPAGGSLHPAAPGEPTVGRSHCASRNLMPRGVSSAARHCQARPTNRGPHLHPLVVPRHGGSTTPSRGVPEPQPQWRWVLRGFQEMARTELHPIGAPSSPLLTGETRAQYRQAGRRSLVCSVCPALGQGNLGHLSSALAPISPKKEEEEGVT